MTDSRLQARRGRMIHLSKDLVPVPVYAIGLTADSNRKPASFKYELARGGNTYRRPERKPLSLRDQHRHNVGTNTRNDWGAEWYIRQRDRQEAGAAQRKRHASA